MSTSSPTIPPDVAAHVLFHYGHTGIPAGKWTAALIALIDQADTTNLGRLEGAYPAYTAAITAMKYDPDGTQHLQNIARGEVTA